MLRKFIFVLLAVGLSALPSTAFSAFQAGDWDFSLAGSGSSDNDFDTNVVSAEGALGYFFTPVIEGVIRQGIGFADTPDDSDWNGSTRVGVDFHFPFDRYVPYLGANIGYLYGDSVEEQFIAGPNLGLKSFVNETTYILTAVEYEFLFDDADEADEAFDDGRFVYTVGIGFRW